MRIIIDADSCPKIVLQYCLDLGQKLNVPVYTVADTSHEFANSKNHIMVDSKKQESDIKIYNFAQKDDLIITKDSGLATLVLGKNVLCISPFGKVFKDSLTGNFKQNGFKKKHTPYSKNDFKDFVNTIKENII